MAHLPAASPAKAQLVRRAELAETMADVLHTDLQQLTEASMSESTARLELALEDIGWQRLVARMQTEFSRSGLEQMATICRLMWRKNPLIRRAVNVRTFYTWSQGLTIQADDEQVNELVQGFYDDPANQRAVFGAKARETLDRTLATDGNLVFALVTAPASGTVQVRTIPWTEVVDVVRNPDDRTDVWFWKRRRHVDGQVQEQLHPDIDHQPTGIRQSRINDLPVRWDQPVIVETTDQLDGDTWGVPEVYAALDWARAYKEFLEDWASYVRSLAEFAWKHQTKTGASARRAKTTHETARTDASTGVRRTAGATAVGTDVSGLEPIKQPGAHVDADSGRPLAVMVGAAMDIPYSILTGDADNSNLATAKTLDRPFELALTSRRGRVTSLYQRMFRHVIDSAVRAPRGPLPGRVERDEWGRTVVVLPDTVDPNVTIDWPPLVEHNLKDVIDAIGAANGTGLMPPDVTLRLLLTALDVDDVDEVIDTAMDAAAAAATKDEAVAAAESVVARALAYEMAKLEEA